jgi:hypothetical protein
MKMAKEVKQSDVVEQNPQGGGSYVRHADGSLSVNQADLQKTTPADELAGTENTKE